MAGVVLCLLFAVALPSGISLSWSSWLYMLISLLGIGVCRIDIFTKN